MIKTCYLILGNTSANLRVWKGEDKNRVNAQKFSHVRQDNKRIRTFV